MQAQIKGGAFGRYGKGWRRGQEKKGREMGEAQGVQRPRVDYNSRGLFV